MSGEENTGESRKVEELLRVNAELATELRSLTAKRAERPRRGQASSARGLAGLVGERDTLAIRLEQTETAFAATKADRDGLERQNQELDAEIVELRSGFLGLLRRLRGRALSRISGGGQ